MIPFDHTSGFGRFEEKLSSIAVHAGEMILCARARDIEQKEGHANFVTDVDNAVQAYLKQALLELLPQAAFIGEEQENAALGSGLTWIVDPLDGTTNFIHDYRFSAVSVALMLDARPVLGAVVQPYARELFLAKHGHGALLNGRPISVSAHALDRALVAFGTSPYNAELAEKSLSAALAFLRHAADLRRSGSAALDLAYVACGRQDVYFELSLKPWDYAAGALLVTEAGGMFRMPLLEQDDYGAVSGVIAANAACAKDANALFDAQMN